MPFSKTNVTPKSKSLFFSYHQAYTSTLKPGSNITVSFSLPYRKNVVRLQSIQMSSFFKENFNTHTHYISHVGNKVGIKLPDSQVPVIDSMLLNSAYFLLPLDSHLSIVSRSFQTKQHSAYLLHLHMYTLPVQASIPAKSDFL